MYRSVKRLKFCSAMYLKVFQKLFFIFEIKVSLYIEYVWVLTMILFRNVMMSVMRKIAKLFI